MSAERSAGLMVYRLQPSSSSTEFLLLRASDGGHWTPPKGHLEPGEDDMTAALREAREEAGLDHNHLKVVPEFNVELNYKAHGKSKSVIYFTAKLTEPWPSVAVSDEHTDFRWVGLEEACKLVAFEDTASALRQCHSKIGTLQET